MLVQTELGTRGRDLSKEGREEFETVVMDFQPPPPSYTKKILHPSAQTQHVDGNREILFCLSFMVCMLKLFVDQQQLLLSDPVQAPHLPRSLKLGGRRAG